MLIFSKGDYGMTATFVKMIIDIIERNFNFGGNLDFSDFFTVLILGISIWSFITCHINGMKTKRSINNFIKHKDKLTGNNNIKVNYIEENKLFLDNDYLKNLWNDYKSYMRKNTINDKVPDISKYFNRNTIVEFPSRRQIAQLIPGVLTALGILGTFLGLQDGISQLDMSNPAVIENSIGNLTDGMSLAFISSIVGIVASLIWSYFDRKQYRSYINTLSRFKDVFEESFEVFSTESFIQEILALQNESTTAVKHIASDFSLEFANILKNIVNDDLLPNMNATMTNIVSESLIPSLSNMNSSFEEFTDKASSSQSVALENMIDNFKEEIDNLVSIEFNELKSTLQELTSWHKGVKVELSELIYEIKESALNYQELNISSETVMGKYSELFGELNNINLNIGNKIELITDTMEVLKDLTAFNAETVEEIGLINKEATESYKIVESSLLKLNTNIEDAKDNLEIVSLGLEQSTINFSENLKDGLNTTFEIFDENLSEIGKRLSGTIVEINESVEEMPNIIAALYNEMQSHTIKLREAVETTTELYEEIKDMIFIEKNEAIS